MFRSHLFSEVALYALAALFSAAALPAIYDLTDLRQPVALYAWGDGVYYAAQAKILLETGWVYHHPDLGAPHGLELYDFPHFDALHLLVMKLIGAFTTDWAVVLNVYYLLTFPLAALTSLAVFRHLGLPRLLALGLCLVYAHQPYHYDRGQGHLMLAAYWHVPLFALGVFWLLRPDGLRDAEGVPLWRSWRCRLACAFAFLGVFGGHYYAFFSCLFYLAAGLYTAAQTGRRWPLVESGLLIGAIGLGFMLNLTPNALYWAREGGNRHASAKGPALAEQCSLRITPLLLPHRHHLLPPLRKVTGDYEKQSPLPHLERQSSLGMAAGLGVMALCLIGLFGRPGSGPLHGLGVVTLASILVASVSGFGTLFAYLITPQIHGYGRIVPHLALFGLAAGGLLIARAGLWMPLLIGLLGMAVLDVVPAATEPDRQTVRTQFDGARRFASEVQRAVPAGTAVYFLPGSRFPLERYDYMDLYLFTRGLRFSAPAMINRRSATWQEEVEQRSPAEFLRRIALIGFEALVIDRRSTHTPLMDAVDRLLADEAAPAVPGDRRTFYDLRPHIDRLRRESGPAQWERLTAEARFPVHTRAWTRFRPIAGGVRLGASKKGFVELVNPGPATEVDLTLRVIGSVSVTSGFLGTVDLPDGRLQRRVIIPAGRHWLTFRAKGEQLPSGGWYAIKELKLSPPADSLQARH